MTLLNIEDKPPRPSSARAAKARRVELTMRRLLVKLANKNLKTSTIQTHNNADISKKFAQHGWPKTWSWLWEHAMAR